jgi:foldase protein PrsA
MNELRILMVLCALAAPVAIVAGCGGGVPTGAVATVDGESIDRKAFEHWLAVAAKSTGRPGAQVPKPPNYEACLNQKRKTQPKPGDGRPRTTDAQLKAQCKQEYEGLREQVLQLLVSYQWVEAEAAEMGIAVEDSEIEKSFDQRRKQSFPKDAGYRKFLEDSGQTEEDLRLRIRQELLTDKIREKAIKGEDKVTREQIADYYRKNKVRFAKPERRDVRIVLTQTEKKAEQAKAALAGGESWKSVAKRFSIDQASKAHGGRLPGLAEGQQEKALDAAVFNADRGKLVGPVKTQFGYYVFEVGKIEKASQQTLEQATPTIKQLIVSERQQKALDAFRKKFRAKWRERTKCQEGFVTQDCSNGPKPAPTTAPGTARSQGTGTVQPPPPSREPQRSQK